jgi:hypothetical protein
VVLRQISAENESTLRPMMLPSFLACQNSRNSAKILQNMENRANVEEDEPRTLR